MNLTCILLIKRHETLTWVKKSVISKSENREHDHIWSGPHIWHHTHPVLFDYPAGQNKAKHSERDISVGKKHRPNAMHGPVQEEHSLPSRVLPQKVDPRWGENHAQEAHSVDKVLVDEDAFGLLDAYESGASECCSHSKGPEYIYFNHGAGL